MLCYPWVHHPKLIQINRSVFFLSLEIRYVMASTIVAGSVFPDGPAAVSRALGHKTPWGRTMSQGGTIDVDRLVGNSLRSESHDTAAIGPGGAEFDP
jgi:hypothetical protein